MKQREVVATYRATGSLRKTARKLGISVQTVRKVLITAGLYAGPRVEKIRELASLGMSTPKIAEMLGLSPKTVSSYMPYTKGSYLTAPMAKSLNALRIAKTREKQRQRRQEQ